MASLQFFHFILSFLDGTEFETLTLTYQICCSNKDVCPNKSVSPNNSVCLNNPVFILLASYPIYGQQPRVAVQNPVVAPRPWWEVQGAAGVVEAGVPQSNKCNGGDSCCTVDKPCGEGEGDCDSDEECSGNLFCSRTCGDQVQGGLASLGGEWDIADDCCLDPIKNQDAAILNKVRRALQSIRELIDFPALDFLWSRPSV